MKEPSEESPSEADDKRGRRKINIEYIEDKSRRHITFSKRKAGIMKKAYELSTLTGTQILLLVASETGHVYTFATPKLQPLITKPEGKNLIQSCLNAPDNPPSDLSVVGVSTAGAGGGADDDRDNPYGLVPGRSGLGGKPPEVPKSHIAPGAYPSMMDGMGFPGGSAQYGLPLFSGGPFPSLGGVPQLVRGGYPSVASSSGGGGYAPMEAAGYWSAMASQSAGYAAAAAAAGGLSGPSGAGGIGMGMGGGRGSSAGGGGPVHSLPPPVYGSHPMSSALGTAQFAKQ